MEYIFFDKSIVIAGVFVSFQLPTPPNPIYVWIQKQSDKAIAYYQRL